MAEHISNRECLGYLLYPVVLFVLSALFTLGIIMINKETGLLLIRVLKGI